MIDECPYPLSRKKWLTFLFVTFKLNACSLRSIDHSQNLIRCNLWMCKTFGLQYKILPFIVLIYIVHNIEINRIFLINWIINPARCAFPINHQTWYDIVSKIFEFLYPCFRFLAILVHKVLWECCCYKIFPFNIICHPSIWKKILFWTKCCYFFWKYSHWGFKC